MGTVIEVCNKVEEAVKGFLPMLENKLSSHTEDFEENIHIQLYAGKNGICNDLQPNYLNDPYFAMQQMYKTSWKRKQKNKEQRAREYRDWKLKSIFPDSSNRLGLPSRNSNTPNIIRVISAILSKLMWGKKAFISIPPGFTPPTI